jgi:hypothetical protein
MWSQILLNSPKVPPFKLNEVEVPEGESPKDFIRIDHGDRQEFTIMYQLVAVDPKTKEAFYIRTQDRKDGKVLWQLGDAKADTTARLVDVFKRLPGYTTEEDPGDLIARAALVLERVADDLEARKIGQKALVNMIVGETEE